MLPRSRTPVIASIVDCRGIFATFPERAFRGLSAPIAPEDLSLTDIPPSQAFRHENFFLNREESSTARTSTTSTPKIYPSRLFTDAGKRANVELPSAKYFGGSREIPGQNDFTRRRSSSSTEKFWIRCLVKGR